MYHLYQQYFTTIYLGTHWSSEICEKAVQKCCVDLTKFMDPSLIIPLLVQSGHLRLEQVTVILSLQTKTEQTLQLLALLHRSGRYAYQGLFKALKDETEHEAHQELLQQLESTCDCKSSGGCPCPAITSLYCISVYGSNCLWLSQIPLKL